MSSLADGEYDIAIRVGCAPSKSALPSASVTYSSSVKLVLDRNAPVELAQHARPAGPYYPGDDISMVFNEAIATSGISVLAKISDGTTLGMNDLLVLYSEKSVFIDFSPSMSVSVWIVFHSLPFVQHVTIVHTAGLPDWQDRGDCVGWCGR